MARIPPGDNWVLGNVLIVAFLLATVPFVMLIVRNERKFAVEKNAAELQSRWQPGN